MYKITNNNKKAFSLIEVLIYFVLLTMLTLILTPAITSSQAKKRCIEGGRITFTGDGQVYGTNADKVTIIQTNICNVEDSIKRPAVNDYGVEHWREYFKELKRYYEYLHYKSDRANDKDCIEYSYKWKAPTQKIYLTIVGGGGGGSGAFFITGDTNLMIQSACASVKYTVSGGVYRCDTKAEEQKKDEYYTDEDGNIQKREITENVTVNASENCSSTVGGEPTCVSVGRSFAGKSVYLGGSGGMGGNFLLGPNYYSDIQSNLGNYNPGNALFLTPGNEYKIITGKGGLGGKSQLFSGFEKFLHPYESILYQYIARSPSKSDPPDKAVESEKSIGMNGRPSCILTAGSSDCNTTFGAKGPKFVQAAGGAGANGLMAVSSSHSSGAGYRISPTAEEQFNIYYTYPLSPYLNTGYMKANQSTVVNPEYTGGLALFPENGYTTATPGEVGSIVIGGRGSGSFFGAGRWGAGGDGGYVYNGNTTADTLVKAYYAAVASDSIEAIKKAEDALKDINGKPGKSGMVELRWFSTCQ